jgi:hypothetical protein
LSDELTPPTLKRRRKISGAESFDDLSLRQTVSQPLALRIAHDRHRFQERRGEICARK